MGPMRNATTSPASAVAVEWEEKLLREMTARMKRGIRKMPKGYQNFFSDLTREQPRSKSYFQHVPHVADAMATAGAPLDSVVAPLHAEESRIVAKHYAHRYASLSECQQVEVNAQAALDSVQLRVAAEFARLGHVPEYLAIALQEAASVHATAIKTLSAVTLRDCK